LKEKEYIKPARILASLNEYGFTQMGLAQPSGDYKKSRKIDFGIHKLRHSFAVLMLEGGCDILQPKQNDGSFGHQTHHNLFKRHSRTSTSPDHETPAE